MSKESMTPTRPLTNDQQFFFDHAGYGYNQFTETPEAGRTSGAIKLAEAEATFMRAAQIADVLIEWANDSDGAYSAKKDGNKFKSCEFASILINSECAASLASILDADKNYRRVIRAELANECLPLLQAAIDKAGK